MAASILSTACQAQQLSPQQTPKGQESSRPVRMQTLGVEALPMASQAALIWADDVSDCSTWSFGNGSNEAGQPWTDIDINFECTTEGPSGPYNGWAGGNPVGTPAPGLNSTTSDNGFLMIDSDLFGADANYDASWVENSWVQTVDPIDCSAYPYVSISFQTRYRCWDNGGSDGSEKCFVEISRDGTTWPTLTNAYVTDWMNEGMVDYNGEMVQCRYEVFPDSETGYETDNPSILEFDITEAAGEQGTIWVRFRWVGTWGYSWEIDDVEVYETPENDTRIDNYLSYSNYAQTGVYEYGAWPLSQIPSDLQAGAKVYNVGYADQSGVMMDLDVNGNTYASNTLNTLGSAANDTLLVSYQPTGLGTQTLNYSLFADAEDENPSNNVALQSFEVTEYHFGRDNGVVTEAFPGDGTDDFIAMPLFDIENDVTIYGIDVAILDGSEDGTPIRAFLVDMFDDLALTEQYGGEFISTNEIEIAPGYTNSGDGEIVWYTLMLEEPFEAVAGQWIGAAFEHYGGANLQIGEAQYTQDQTAFVYGPFGSGSAYDWYYTNEVPMVRLNLDPSAQPPVTYGCTDPVACNYNSNANVDDGFCEYDSCAGCLDSAACNYDSSAILDDGSCDYGCYGCTDPLAFNFDVFATVDDGSCTYFEASCNYIGYPEWSNMELGIQSADSLVHMFAIEVSQEVVLNVPGLIQEPTSGSFYNVLNWSNLTVTGMPTGLSFSDFPSEVDANNQVCLSYTGIPTEIGEFVVIVSGDLVLSVFGNPYPIGLYEAPFVVSVVSNPNPIPGCTYPNATNYSPFSTVEDGSCYFAGCTNPEALNYQMFATVDDGSCDNSNCQSSCPADLDGDGTTGTPDLLQFLASFGFVCLD